jgi:hypothetical protein
MPSADDHIQQIQSRVEAERAHLSVLDAQIKDANLRRNLQEATPWLDDVENVFLRSARQQERTPEASARWLSYAEQPLGWAIARRKELQEIVAKYRPNAQTIG